MSLTVISVPLPITLVGTPPFQASLVDQLGTGGGGGLTAGWSPGAQITVQPSFLTHHTKLVGWGVFLELALAFDDNAGAFNAAGKLGKLVATVLPTGDTSNQQANYQPPMVPGDALDSAVLWDGASEDCPAIGRYHYSVHQVQPFPPVITYSWSTVPPTPMPISGGNNLPIPLDLSVYPQAALRLALTPSLCATNSSGGVSGNPLLIVLDGTARFVLDI